MGLFCQLAQISRGIGLNDFFKAIALLIRGWINERNREKAASNRSDIANNLAAGGRVQHSADKYSDLAARSERHSDE